MNPNAISDALRTQQPSEDLEIKRKVIALSALGLLDFSLISLYQTGVIKRMPDLPLKFFDSNGVNASREAYLFGVPDGPVSATVYAATMVLAAAGGTKESGRGPVFDVLLGGAIAGNAAGALYYLYDMIFNQKKVCMYCVAGAAINIASAILVAPIAVKSLKKMIS